MNRLTKINSNGVTYMAIAEGLPKKDQELEGSKPILEGFYAMVQKLAAYEDTGLEPEDILSNIKTLSSELNNAFEELKEHQRLEEQGLLIKLPCKAGAIVYEANVNRNIISSYRVTSIIIVNNESRNYKWELIEGICSNLNGFNEFALGKTIFLTREEAEKLLKEIK